MFEDRIGALRLSLSCLFAFDLFALFCPGNRGAPSMWRGLMTEPVLSSDSLLGLGFLCVTALVGTWYIVRTLRAQRPADEALHCDHNWLTVSRAKWLDRSGALVSHTYAISRVYQLRYVAFAKPRGSVVRGLRFQVDGKRQGIFSQLEPPEATTILAALKKFGIDVVDDATLTTLVTEALSERAENVRTANECD